MDMSKYKGMFLSESKEHLRSMSTLLINLEKNPADREGIDSLFREAHSVKGMAASMGYDRTTELAHHLEDYMDGFRKSGAVPSAAVDRLLGGIDLLEGLLADIEADRVERPIAAFLAAGGEPETVEYDAEPELISDPPPAGEPLSVGDAGEPSPLSADPSSLRLVVELTPDAMAPSARFLLLLRETARLGTLVVSVPSEAQLRKGGDIRRMELTLDTELDPDRVVELLSGVSDVARVFRPASSAAPPKRGRREAQPQTVRVRTDLLDHFINLTGELITQRYMLQTASREERWSDVQGGLDHLARLISALHHNVLQVRMMPLESITGHLPRLVRDLARKTGKDVALRVEGEEVELDRAILEGLADPLVHMVRNAVDHGIEEQGEVVVRAWRERDMVLLEVADNGRGIDAHVIRQKAVARGMISPAQARSLRDREALQLVCIPGFSTATEITETSGRGVGMDVVKSAVENLGGGLEILSEPGKGTRMRLKLPLSVAIIQILLVECSGRTIGIPITKVERTLDLPREEIQTSGRKAVIQLGEEMIPLLSLHKILGLPKHPSEGSVSVVITEGRGRRVGLVVDRFCGQREAFVKTLAFPLDSLAGVSGATVIGDGSIIFIIDPQYLLEERTVAPLSRVPGDCR